MTDAQIFQLVGITLAPLGLAWALSPKIMRRTIKEIVSNDGVLLLSGMLAVIMGYLILAFHSSWSSTNAAIITILGWVALLKGLAILVLPALGINVATALRKLRQYYIIMPWLVLFVGVAALYLGYSA